MPLVEVVEVLPAHIEKVWEVVNDVESFPRLMEHVRSLKVLEQGSGYRLSSWEVDLKGCIMRWVEREEIDHERYHIDYRAIKGDLAEFDGHWQLERLTDDTTRVTLTARFEIGIPGLSEMLNPVAELSIRENSQNMLLSIGTQASEKPIVEEVSPTLQSRS